MSTTLHVCSCFDRQNCYGNIRCAIKTIPPNISGLENYVSISRGFRFAAIATSDWFCCFFFSTTWWRILGRHLASVKFCHSSNCCHEPGKRCSTSSFDDHSVFRCSHSHADNQHHSANPKYCNCFVLWPSSECKHIISICSVVVARSCSQHAHKHT